MQMYARWWFQVFCFSSLFDLFGEMIPFDYFLSDGLKPPTSMVMLKDFLNNNVLFGLVIQ